MDWVGIMIGASTNDDGVAVGVMDVVAGAVGVLVVGIVVVMLAP